MIEKIIILCMTIFFILFILIIIRDINKFDKIPRENPNPWFNSKLENIQN